MAELLFFKEGELQMRAPIPPAGLVLGRSTDADLVLPDKGVSRVQCRVIAEGDHHMVYDLSSRGTRVDHRTAEDEGLPLADGDQLLLGAFTVLFSAVVRPEADDEPTLTGRRHKGHTVLQMDGLPLRGRARVRLETAAGETTLALRPEPGWSLVVGSAPDGENVLRIDDHYASARHLRISWKDGAWMVHDLASRNGTWVDGVRVNEAWLGVRSMLRLGETSLAFEQDQGGVGAQPQPLPGLVSADPAMQPLLEQVRRLAPSRVSVAIHGETGTGKEVVARAIHQLSERREGPFVALNCGALPFELVESELFGHEKGAFTGADKPRAGAFEEADGGTLFLDEVGDLPLAVQVKLLRALESGEVRRLGGGKTTVVDVRVVCATHRDLLAAVETGTFREDLYYRLCVAPVELPPLRQRVGDVVPLAEHFIAMLAPGNERITLTPAARAYLEGHRWPGNAREVRNVVQVALLQRQGPVITESDLVLRRAARHGRPLDTIRVAGKTLADIEKEAYRLALERHEGDRPSALTELGVPRSTFFRKLEEFGLGEKK